MSYKYKDEILADIGPEPNCNYDFEKEEYYKKIDELNHVYAQAAKADEYEAKAKAWDKLEEYLSTSPYDGIDMDTLKNRLITFMVESGESDEV